MHYVNGGRTSSVLEWLHAVPRGVLDADPRLLLVQAWVAALRGSEDGHARARWRAARARRAGRRAAPGRLRLAGVERRRCCARRSPGATWRRCLEDGARSARARGPGLAVAAGGDVVARLGPLLQRRARRSPSAGWRRRAALAPRGRAVGRRLRRDRRPVADRRHARRPRRADAAGARGASTWRASTGCSTRARSARCTPRTASRWPRTGRREEALPELEQGVFLRRLWGQPLDLADGLIALAPPWPRGDRARAAALFAEARGARWPAARDPGVLPARLAAARRARRGRRRAAS